MKDPTSLNGRLITGHYYRKDKVRLVIAVVLVLISAVASFIIGAFLFRAPFATRLTASLAKVQLARTSDFVTDADASNVTPGANASSDNQDHTKPLASRSQAPQLTAVPNLLTSESVITAFNCARSGQRLPPYIRDPKLDDTAKNILKRVITDPTKPLQDFEQDFTLTGQLLLDTAYPVLSQCMIGGFDAGRVDKLAQSSRIGVAIAPMQVYDDTLYLTIIVGY